MRSFGMVAIALLAGAGASAAAAGVDVRFVEACEDGVARGRGPATLAIDLVVAEPFGGTLDASLEAAGEASAFETFSRALELAPGDHRVTIAFTQVASRAGSVSWTLRDANGTTVAAGRAPIAWTPELVPLALTDLPGRGARRSPARAFDRAEPYLHHDAVIIAGRDFETLERAQRQALLDAAAQGIALVVETPHGALPDALRSLEDPATLAWRGADGRWLSEIPWGFGFVRLSTLGLLEETDVPDAPRQLALSAVPHVPRLVGIAPEPRRIAGFANASMPWVVELWTRDRAADEAASLRTWRATMTAAACAVLLPSLLLLHGFRRRSAPAPRVVAVAALLFACLPALSWAFLAHFTLPRKDHDTIAIRHDAAGRVDLRRHYVEAGGGGGTTRPVARLPVDASTFVDDVTDGWGRTRAVEIGARLAVEPMPLATSVDQHVALTATSAGPGSRTWDSDLAWQPGAVVGAIVARVDFDDAVVLFPPRAIPLGAVRAGERVDLSSRFALALATDRLAMLTERQARLVRLATTVLFVRSVSRGPDEPLVVVGLPARVDADAAADRREDSVADVQPLAIAGRPDGALAWIGLAAPTTDSGNTITARVPTVALAGSLPAAHGTIQASGNYGTPLDVVDPPGIALDTPCDDGFACVELQRRRNARATRGVLLGWRPTDADGPP